MSLMSRGSLGVENVGAESRVLGGFFKFTYFVEH